MLVWLAGSLASWSACWLAGWLAGWLRLAGWLAGRLAAWQASRLAGRLAGRPAGVKTLYFLSCINVFAKNVVKLMIFDAFLNEVYLPLTIISPNNI